MCPPIFHPESIPGASGNVEMRNAKNRRERDVGDLKARRGENLVTDETQMKHGSGSQDAFQCFLGAVFYPCFIRVSSVAKFSADRPGRIQPFMPGGS